MTCILSAFIYNLFYIPFSIAFELDIPPKFIVFDIVMILLNVADIYIRAKTTMDKKGLIVSNEIHTFNHYINHGKFIFDLISILPLDYIFWISGVS